ncbi:MAG TPA: molybdopterin-dependent oxidoreductase [Acidimicrobiia bacterium]
MAGRRTNLALLGFAVVALLSGIGAFLVGTPAGRWVVVAHGVVALAIIVLMPWKGMIVRRGVARVRPGRAMSIVLTVVTVGAIATGVVLVTGMAESIGPVTTMQLHVSLGLLMVSLTLVHTLQRPVPFRRADRSRRNLLRAGGVLAAAGGLWLSVEGFLDAVGARGGARRFTGSHEIVEPAQVPITQWLNDRVQHLDRVAHHVVMGDQSMTVATLESGGDVVEATLDCTGGWYTTQPWSGTRLDRVLEGLAGESIVVRSASGYWRRFPFDQASWLLLATHMAGEPLSDGHGGPVRLVAPGRRGYWWVKWVVSVEVDDRPSWWQPPLPTA